MPKDRRPDPEDEAPTDEVVIERPPTDDDDVPRDPGPPRLEVAAVTALLASVVLAVVPPTAGVAPLAWIAGMVMVLLSRRWGPGDKGVALVAFGILGVPFIALGHDELRAPVSIVTGVVLVALWGAAAWWLLRRSRREREDGRGLRMS